MASQAEILAVLRRAWTPHPGQIKVGQAVFNSPARMIYVECGRKFGKTECSVYMCWLYACTVPNAEVYYLAPLVKQAKELVWWNNRMQTCNTQADWFQAAMEKAMGGPIRIMNQEGRILLPNGSFIKVDGSDNVNAQRGLKPDFVAADEYRDFQSNWLPTVRPNMMVKEGKILFISTPPHSPNHAYDWARLCERMHDQKNERYYYLSMPTHANVAHLPGGAEMLEIEKAELYEQGKVNEWKREYLAQFVLDNEHAVIPQLNKSKILPHADIMTKVQKISEPQWVLAINPGNSTVMGALLCVYDDRSASLYVVDALYEWDSQEAAVRKSGEKLKTMVNGYGMQFGHVDSPYVDPDMRDFMVEEEGLDEVEVVVNCRYPWLARDLYECFGVSAYVATAETKQAEYNINLIKDICIADRLFISEKAHKLVDEASKYTRNPESLKIDGIRTVENQVLLVDCLKYVLDSVGYTFETVPNKIIPDESSSFEWNLKRLENIRNYDQEEFLDF